MPPSAFPELQSKRLQLRRLQTTDWRMISFLRTDQSVNAFVKRPSAETEEKALAFITKINKGLEEQQMYYWKITNKESPDMIGSICLWQFSQDRKTAEVGYDLHPTYQRLGIMNEALKTVIDFGFQDLKLEKMEAYTHHSNTSSLKLLERNGFQLVEGKKDADNADNVVYALSMLNRSP